MCVFRKTKKTLYIAIFMMLPYILAYGNTPNSDTAFSNYVISEEILSAPSRIKPFFEKHGLSFENIFLCHYAALELRDLIRERDLRDGDIARLNMKLLEGDIRIEKDPSSFGFVRTDTFRTTKRKYNYVVLNFKKEHARVKVVFTKQDTTEDELREFGVITQEDRESFSSLPLDGIWFTRYPEPKLIEPASPVTVRTSPPGATEIITVNDHQEVLGLIEEHFPGGAIVFNFDSHSDMGNIENGLSESNWISYGIAKGSLSGYYWISNYDRRGMRCVYYEHGEKARLLTTDEIPDLSGSSLPVAVTVDLDYLISNETREPSERAVGIEASEIVKLLREKNIPTDTVFVSISQDYIMPGLERIAREKLQNVFISAGDQQRTQSTYAAPENEAIIEKARQMHSYNFAHTPLLPEKTGLCHIISESILPAGQRGILRRLEQNMRGKDFSEKIIVLSDINTDNVEEVLQAIRNAKEKALEIYRSQGFDRIDFIVACPSKDLVPEIKTRLDTNALAFEPGKGTLVQAEGIMLALRALYTGSAEKLRTAYEIINGKSVPEELSEINDIHELAKRMLFVLPTASATNPSEEIKLNLIIERYIMSAA
jgi:hypothetical protein